MANTRRRLYPEGYSQLTVVVSVYVRDALERIAIRQGLSLSQLTNRILSDDLRERGELPLREPVAVGDGAGPKE